MNSPINTIRILKSRGCFKRVLLKSKNYLYRWPRSWKPPFDSVAVVFLIKVVRVTLPNFSSTLQIRYCIKYGVFKNSRLGWQVDFTGLFFVASALLVVNIWRGNEIYTLLIFRLKIKAFLDSFLTIRNPQLLASLRELVLYRSYRKTL